MFSAGAIRMIEGYQRWISPRKGYACAHRILHGGTGCSGFAKAAIAEHGAIRALPLVRARFRACHAATLQLQAQDPLPPGQRRRSRWWDCLHGCDISYCCGGGRSSPSDGCDCTPGDCGS